MPLLRAFENHDYWPEFGTLVIRDVPRPDQVRPSAGAKLAAHAVDTQPSGSFARAGDGWVEAVAADDHHIVRVEVHDGPPGDDDLPGWGDALETPFVTSGLVRLALVVGGPVGAPIDLGEPGLYRLQIARRPLVAGNSPGGWPCEYRLRCWPVDTPPEQPRWLRRSRPLVDDRPAGEQGAFDGRHRSALTDVVMLTLWAAESATPVTLAVLADRLLTTTATVRTIVGHPEASLALSVDGDLDDEDAPLALTVLARKPAMVRTTRTAASPPRPGAAVRQSTPGRRSTPGVRGVRPVAARPAIKRENGAGAEDGQA